MKIKIAYLACLFTLFSCSRSMHLPSPDGENNIHSKGQKYIASTLNLNHRLNAIGVYGQYGLTNHLSAGLSLSGFNKHFSITPSIGLFKNIINKADTTSKIKLQLFSSMGFGYAKGTFKDIALPFFGSSNEFPEYSFTASKGFLSAGLKTYRKDIDFCVRLKYSLINVNQIAVNHHNTIEPDFASVIESNNLLKSLDLDVRLVLGKKKHYFIGYTTSLFRSIDSSVNEVFSPVINFYFGTQFYF
jgi:hypothetical protein